MLDKTEQRECAHSCLFNKIKPFMYQTCYCNKRKVCLFIMRTNDKVTGKKRLHASLVICAE